MALLACGFISACSGPDDGTSPAATGESAGGAPGAEARPAFQGNRREYTEALFGCAQQRDIPVHLAEDSTEGLVLKTLDGITDEQMMELMRALDECGDEVGAPPTPQTDAEIREMYDHSVEAYECIVEAGMSPAPPPAFQSFLESYRNSEPYYDPYYADVGSGATSDEGALRLRACPKDTLAWW